MSGITIKRGGKPSHEMRERQEQYIEWILTPSTERKPLTRAALADSLEVSSQTLRNYARDPWVQSEMVKRGRAIARVERASDVLDALYTRATDPESGSAGVSAARVWLDWVDKRVEDGIDPSDLEDMSKEDLMELIDALFDA